MALVHELERSGNWLFRRRSWLPVVFIAAGIAGLYLTNRQAIIFNLTPELIFLGISLLGEAVRIYTVGHAAKNTSGRNTTAGQIADELNTTGIYSLVRHPLYIGNFLMWLGPVLFVRSLVFLILFILVYWLYYERIMFAEEQFSLKSVLKREYNSFINIFLIFTLLDLFRNYFLSERIYLTPMWIYIAIPAGIIWIVIRLVYKRTSLLKEDDR